MFRRKEESANESGSSQAQGSPSTQEAGHNASAVMAASASDTASHAPVQSSHSQAPAASAQAAHVSYAPIAAAARSAGEPSRPAAAPSGNYRPSPAAEFNRPPARTAGETARPSSQPNASFATGSEKAPGTKSNRRVLTVGNDILLKGEIATCDRLVIEGRVEAKLSDVHTVEIAESGSFKGTAEVEDAEISGIFEGDLVVRNRLVIYASGEVRGNIGYGEIEIERGGKLTGQIKTVAQGTAAKAKPFEVPESKSRASAKEATAA